MEKNPIKAHFEKLLRIKLEDDVLLKQVFIHRSYVNECREKGLEHNERLEFLGDAVLELVVTDYLYREFPNPEGDLTNWRSALVKGEMLSKISRSMGIGQFLFLSHGEEKGGGREKDYILANALEAFIGYLYLTKGFAACQKFIAKFILVHLPEILEKNLHIDAKSYFQESSQEKLGITPEYRVLQEEGPDHNKLFTMGAYLSGELIGSGSGSSKQSAEQEAAKEAIRVKKW